MILRRRILGVEAAPVRREAVQVHGDDAGPEVDPPDAPHVPRHGTVRRRKAEILRGDLSKGSSKRAKGFGLGLSAGARAFGAFQAT